MAYISVTLGYRATAALEYSHSQELEFVRETAKISYLTAGKQN